MEESESEPEEKEETETKEGGLLQFFLDNEQYFVNQLVNRETGKLIDFDGPVEKVESVEQVEQVSQVYQQEDFDRELE